MSKSRAFSSINTPLTAPIFYILLALAVRELHGYDIMKQVRLDSNGKITLGPGTLYGAIKRMLEDKLIKAVETNHSRRKYYMLTEKGRSIFLNELNRYDEAVQLAKKKILLTYPISKLTLAYA